MTKAALATLMLLGAAAAPGVGRAAGLSAKFQACAARAGANVVQQTVCDQSEIGAQDDRLNKAYQQVMRQLAADPARKAALRDRQRAWIKERDYSCKLNGDTTDAGCVLTKTTARADELEAQVRF